MSSPDGPDGHANSGLEPFREEKSASVEMMLFEALSYQLIEKGVLTKNDALSVVQTVAQVRRGRLPDGESAHLDAELGRLRRLYESFEALQDRPTTSVDHANVRQLRPPRHGDSPKFPRDEH